MELDIEELIQRGSERAAGQISQAFDSFGLHNEKFKRSVAKCIEGNFDIILHQMKNVTPAPQPPKIEPKQKASESHG